MVNTLEYLCPALTITVTCHLTTPPGEDPCQDMTSVPSSGMIAMTSSRDMWVLTEANMTEQDIPRQLSSMTTRGNITQRLNILWGLDYFFDKDFVFQISLNKNCIVYVLDGRPHSDWWRVETEQGLSGFYPSNCLRQI